MKFGETPLAEAQGAILAHSVKLGTRALKKGRALTGEDIAALEAAGKTTVIVARLEPGDVIENQAADRVAAALTCPGVSSRRPSPGGPISMPRAPGFAWSIAKRSIAST